MGMKISPDTINRRERLAFPVGLFTTGEEGEGLEAVWRSDSAAMCLLCEQEVMG